jgi:hypothetical protein
MPERSNIGRILCSCSSNKAWSSCRTFNIPSSESRKWLFMGLVCPAELLSHPLSHQNASSRLAHAENISPDREPCSAGTEKAISPQGSLIHVQRESARHSRLLREVSYPSGTIGSLADLSQGMRLSTVRFRFAEKICARHGDFLTALLESRV